MNLLGKDHRGGTAIPQLVEHTARDTPPDALVIRGYFGEGAEFEEYLPNERRFDMFRTDGTHAGSINYRLTGTTHSEMETPWGSVTIEYDQKPLSQYRVLKEHTPAAVVTSSAFRPIAIRFQNGQELVFKQKAWKLKFHAKSDLGHFEIEYGGLHPDDPVLHKAKIFLLEGISRWGTTPSPGYRAWRISIIRNSGMDRDAFFSVLSAFTCHFYSLLSKEPGTLGAASWLPFRI